MSSLNITVKHGASPSQAQQTNPEEQIETKINSWFKQTTWNEAKREISPDKVLGKEEEEKLSFGERMTYKSYLSTKRQYREIRTKMGVLKNFIKRWPKSMSCKDIYFGEKESKAKEKLNDQEKQAIRKQRAIAYMGVYKLYKTHKLMNRILLSILNDIYNSVDACTSAKDMWKRVERLMRGTIQNKVDRETRFTNEFDQFVAEPGEALVSVYNHFAQLMNDLERNDMHFPIQFEKLVNVSRAKKFEKSHDPLALVAHTGSSSRNTSSYYVTHPTSMVDYEDEYQQDDVHTNSEDPLTSSMLNSGNAGRNNRRAYVQEEIIEGSKAPNETRNVQRTLPTSSLGNTSTVQCYNCSGKGHYAWNCPKPRVQDSKYFMEQMLLAKQDEAGVILTDEQNDFLFADASRMEEIKELSANICLMARIQPADNTSDAGPSYDSAFISEVQSSSNTENEEQMYPTHTKIINSTIGDDQIDSDIIFDSPNGNVNSGSIEKDTHIPDLCALEQLARNAYQEAEKQQIFAQKVQKQNTTLTSQLELYKERVRVLENINGDNNYLNEFLEADKRAKHFSQQAQSQFVRDRYIIRDLEKQRDKLDLDVKYYKRQNEELQKTHSILKRQMSENEDKYHDTVLDLEAKLKKNVDLILKLGNSLQGMFMLGPKPLSVYDQQLKHGLGYPNPYTLKQAISQCPKLYLASSLGNSEISLNVRDTEDTLDDASKSQQKVYEKMNDPIAVANKQNCWTIDYAQINALYKDFVPQKELSAEQTYFPSSFIPSDKNSNATPSIPASMPNENVSLDFTVQSLIKECDNVKLEYQKLFDSIKKTRSQNQTKMEELIAHVFEKTYAYGAIRAENQNLLITISELKTRLANVEKTSPAKQKGVNSNKNVIAPGMYKVVTTHESQTHEAKHDLSSTRMAAASSVRGPMNRDSHVKNKNVIDVDVANASKVKTLLCVSCMQNVLIPCHDNCFANYKLNVRSNVRRPLSTKPRTRKSYDTTYVVRKTRFSKESTLSKSLDTTYVVSKPKIDVGSTSKANDKVSSTKRRNVRDKSLSTYMQNKIQTSQIWQKWFESKPNVVWSPVNTNQMVVQIVLWIVDSGCSKHMMGDRSLLKNFIEKFMGTVRFENDNFAAITGYGDYIQDNITICHVYYVEGLGHNLFSVRQFCDGDLEVAFHSKTCYVCNLEGDDLLIGGRKSILYTISIFDMAASSPVCLMSKATSTKSWLWHRRLSHLNFGTINDLTILDLVDGLPKFKYEKDHLCSACERGKTKKASHPLKLIPSDHSKLELLHMDLCGLMRVALINGKKYILVIVDDYSRHTWVYFLHSKDENPEIIKKFIAHAQLNYKTKVCKIRTDNDTEFKNATLKAHYEKLGIMKQFSTTRTPQQNGVVERRNRTLVEAARMMLIFSRLLEFLWAKAPTNDQEDLGKMKPKADIGVFIGYSETSRGFRIYNSRTKKIIETTNVKFDELTSMASEHDCLEPKLQRFINQNSSAEEMNTPSKEDLDNFFGSMFEQSFEKKSSNTPINSDAQPTQFHEDSPSTSSIIVDEHETSPIATTSDELTSPISLKEADEFNQEDFAHFDGNSQFVSYNPLSREEIESSTTALEPLNV
ncbi:integrase, catalytic region, zinc finger, CCHC-type containing protein [Tanacetum coccineum]